MYHVFIFLLNYMYTHTVYIHAYICIYTIYNFYIHIQQHRNFGSFHLRMRHILNIANLWVYMVEQLNES